MLNYDHNKSKEFYIDIFKKVGFEENISEDKQAIKEQKSAIEEKVKKINIIDIKIDNLKESYVVHKEMKNFSVVEKPEDLLMNFNLSRDELIAILKKNLNLS